MSALPVPATVRCRSCGHIHCSTVCHVCKTPVGAIAVPTRTPGFVPTQYGFLEVLKGDK